MKRFLLLLATCFLSVAGRLSAEAVSELKVQGSIDGENVIFELALTAPTAGTDEFMLAKGDIVYLDGDFPKGSKLVRRADGYVLKPGRRGWRRRGHVRFRFACWAEKDGDWRRAGFRLPSAGVRRIEMLCDRRDLDVRFPGALNVERGQDKSGRLVVSAYLGVTDSFVVRWKPKIKKLNSELVVACRANTVATAEVGALRVDTVFSYNIIQGALTKIEFALPELSVMRVSGEGIRSWEIEQAEGLHPRLVVALSRPVRGRYRLRVEGEQALPKFPAATELPVLEPLGVIRTSGFLLLGTDSAVKLQVRKESGITQIDPAAFPREIFGDGNARRRTIPSREVSAYQFANLPYTLALVADDIVSNIRVDDRVVLRLADDVLSFEATFELTVRDAPIRDVLIECAGDAGWTVTEISGRQVADLDSDVREEDGLRRLYVPFKKAVLGTVLVKVQMERPQEGDGQGFSVPQLHVVGAGSERGYVILASEKGILLKADKMSGLYEVYTGASGMRVPGARQAFRFKSAAWALAVEVERTKPAIASEVFHLISLGEGVMYCSAAITYHIGGAPVQEFQVRVPQTIESVEFAGADIEGWQRQGDVCSVRLQTKRMGDYTLLVTYDSQFAYNDATIEVGGIETVGSSSEMGFVAVASAASLTLKEKGSLPASIIKIDRDEIPAAYAAPINAPIIKAYKYVRNPHAVKFQLEPLKTVELLGQIADYVRLETRLSRKGELVTTATYYIKNASRQYLIARLPDGVDLWTIKYVYEDGGKKQVRSQEQDGQIMVPVARPLDPNTPIAIELVYAGKIRKFGFWQSGVLGVELQAPLLPKTHAAFSRWIVHAPSDACLASPGGSMHYDSSAMDSRVKGVLKKIKRVVKALFVKEYSLSRALSGGMGGGESLEFTHSVDLVGGTPLQVRMAVVPRWMGANSSARYMIGGGLLGIILFVAGVVLKMRPVLAGGVTALVFAAAQSAAGRSLLAVLVVMIVAVVLVRYGMRPALRCMKWLLGMLMKILHGIGGCLSGWRRQKAFSGKPDELIPFEDGGDRCDGFVSLSLTLVVSILSAVVLSVVVAYGADAGAAARQECEVHSRFVVDRVDLDIQGPASTAGEEHSALLVMKLELEGRKGLQAVVLPPESVLLDAKLDSRKAALQAEHQGYILHILDDGRQQVVLRYRQKVSEHDGLFSLQLHLPDNLSNHVKMRLPERGMDIRVTDAVFFKTGNGAAASTAEIVFGSGKGLRVDWSPLVRKVRLEETVFFSEVSSSISLLAGVVDIGHLIRCRISRGELKELALLIPEGMSVTAVSAAGLATWSFDPARRTVEVVLKKAVSGDFELRLQTQIANDGLPYTAEVGVPKVLGCARQRGVVAVAAPAMVQVRSGSVQGVSPMNVEDFSNFMAPKINCGKRNRADNYMSTRQAYRYDNPDKVRLVFGADKVLPDVRIVENSALSIADERTVLSAQLRLELAKSGLFAAKLSVPDGYEVESLTGRDISRWDELDSGVVVYFKRYVADATEINLVAARTLKGVGSRIKVPRVMVERARKYSGRLTVAGERGIRLMVGGQHGVAVIKSSELGRVQPGVLVFKLLRGDWSVELNTEVLAPLVKPEVLQLVDVHEGMLKCKAYINYRIENAGVKHFRIRSPRSGVTLSVTGANIAGVHEIDRERGEWQVDLHRKVESHYHLSIGYQLPFNHEDRQVAVTPLRTIGTDDQRGYLVVTCGGRVQVTADRYSEGLKPEDSRSVPDKFRAGNLADAILCYRVLRPDFKLQLAVIRHESAAVLPATVNRVELTSVLSDNRKLLTRVKLKLTAGDLRFLRMQLPQPADTLWTVLVDGREVAASRDGESYCIPLEEQGGGLESSVEIIYAGSMGGSRLLRKYSVSAPVFEGLPLNDINWSLFVLPGVEYYGFGGSMDKVAAGGYTRVFDAGGYLAWNRQQRVATADKAREVLKVGEKMASSGHQKEAKLAFQQALNYSQGKVDLNEDARVQLRNVTRQQFKLGLVNRRKAVRYRNNIVDESGVDRQADVQVANFTREYVSQIEQQLSAKDNAALDVVAGRMIDQQAAAVPAVKGIRIVMPQHGQELKFARAVQVDPDNRLTISFREGTGHLPSLAGAFLAMLIVFGLAWVGLPKHKSTSTRECIKTC